MSLTFLDVIFAIGVASGMSGIGIALGARTALWKEEGASMWWTFGCAVLGATLGALFAILLIRAGLFGSLP